MTIIAPRQQTPIARLGTWPARRWAVAIGGAAVTALFMGLSTAMIPTPIFGRAIPTTWWAWPVLVMTSALAGLLAATYVKGNGDTLPKSGLLGGLLGYFAVGCPVCNKIVLLAVGYTGALEWFAPAQPVLAVGGIALLGYALWRRLKGEIACAV